MNQATVNPDVLWWLGLIIAVAGAVKAASYLIGKARQAGQAWIVWWDERKRIRHTLATLTDDEGWPNGSNSLIASHNTLYDKVAGMETALNNLVGQVEEFLTKEDNYGDQS